MKSIGEILAEKKMASRRSGVTREWQDSALRWWQRLGIPGKVTSDWFKEFKTHRDQMEKACSFVVDYPGAISRKKLVYWKLKELLKGGGK